MKEEPLALFVLGATGATGKLVLHQALQRGHIVTAFVRAPKGLMLSHPNLSVAVGDALQAQSISNYLTPGQRVISCLGVGLNAPREFHARAAQAMITAARSRAVKRIIVLSTLGTGLSAHARTPFINIMFRMLGMRRLFDDRAEQDALLLSSGLDVTIVHSALLSNSKPKHDAKAIAPEHITMPRFFGPVVPRMDVAAFLIHEAERVSAESRVTCLVR